MGELHDIDPEVSEDFEDLNRLDEGQIVAALSGEILEDLFYTMRRAGREITGISWEGMNAVAGKMQEQGFPIRFADLLVRDTAESWIVTVCAECGGASRYGGAEQPRFDEKGNSDPFALAKAISKAQRNAMRTLLPYSLIDELYQQWRGKNVPSSAVKSSPKTPVKYSVSRVDVTETEKISDPSPNDGKKVPTAGSPSLKDDWSHEGLLKRIIQAEKALTDANIINYLSDEILRRERRAHLISDTLGENPDERLKVYLSHLNEVWKGRKKN